MAPIKNLLHPFQHDPGTSQPQRLMPELEANAPKIDGRTLADLLAFFTQLAGQINFYDAELQVSNWQPFFNRSIPFLLASVSKFDTGAVDGKFALYRSLFLKRPGKNTLQLLVHFMYYSTIYRINSWHLAVKGSNLPIENLLQALITDRLLDPVQDFIYLSNSAASEHCIRNLDFTPLLNNEIWGLTTADLRQADQTVRARRGRRNRLLGLAEAFAALWPALFEGVKLVVGAAEDSIEPSLMGQQEELKQQHTPHLALLFAFLKLFGHLQSDLNGFTKKHLGFFFREVLRLVPRPAVADKAHIVFEIQKHLDNHLLEKGLLVKDARDRNNADILFALDDEIVVNKAQVEEVRTLYLNSAAAHNNSSLQLLEGVYMAPKADKADGISKDFPDDSLKNWPTLGAQFSRFTDVGKSTPEKYPDARLGFVLTSPVLLLNEGQRKITIKLFCHESANCGSVNEPLLSGMVSGITFLSAFNTVFTNAFLILTKDLIAAAQKKGISEITRLELEKQLPEIPKAECCEGEPVLRENSVQILQSTWETSFLPYLATLLQAPVLALDLLILKEVFAFRRVLKLYFSGKEAWVEPSSYNLLPITQTATGFLIQIEATLEADKPAVTFFNKEALKEDLGTTDPLVKIELDNALKIEYPVVPGAPSEHKPCWLENCPPSGKQFLSPYLFFRQLTIAEGSGADQTSISVAVCGVRNVIVQTDETVMDVNGTVYPFGTRPTIVDFNAVNPPEPPLTNPNLSGPTFYIGSREIFFKNWGNVCINLNWKGKPSNFNEHYKAYLKRDNYHNCATPPAIEPFISGLNECDFEVNLGLLEKGAWNAEASNRKLFNAGSCNAICQNPGFSHSFFVSRTQFNANTDFTPFNGEFERYQAGSRNGFLRFNLRNQDFLHKDYPFVLARQMMAMGKFPEKGVEGAIYYGTGNSVIVFKDTGTKIASLHPFLKTVRDNAGLTKTDVDNIKENTDAARDLGSLDATDITDGEFTDTGLVAGNPALSSSIPDAVTHAGTTATDASQAVTDLENILTNIGIFDLISGSFEFKEDISVPIPNEPWTPIISELSLDYNAEAKITDIGLIHLYPYENTHKPEEIELKPTLLPTFCDEGTLFIGLKQLAPGANLNFLFQLAEATANSESDKAEVLWHYLRSNQWLPLRKGFEVLEDATNSLTTSGIVKISIPGNIDTNNTVLPNNLHWLKVSAVKDVATVSETIGLHTQAIGATFVNTPAHDQLRLQEPLEANKLARLQVADAGVKKVAQPYNSFGGRVPETEDTYYTRASEWLRHKGRGVQKFDYERLVLDAFPEIYKVKCISHSYWLKATRYREDVNAAPGYVLVAVIPDLNKLKAGESFEPKAPLSLLEKIAAYLKNRTSPFARLKVVNPRYEELDICLTVQFMPGRDKVFYQNKLEEDLRLFLAPWAIGEFDKLNFGQCINQSDVVRFIETREYVDFITCFKMLFEFNCADGKVEVAGEVCPLTPRSILVGGLIDVCVADPECESWREGHDTCIAKFPVAAPACRPASNGNLIL